MSDNDNILRTLQRLKTLMDNENATEGEKRAAGRAFSRLLDRYNLNEEQLYTDLREETSITLIARTDSDKALLSHIGWCLGLSVFKVRQGKRTLKKYMLKGDPLVVDLVEPLYLAHRKRFANRVKAYALGLANAMFPPMPREGPSGKKPKPLTPEERKSMMAGFNSGERVPVRALESEE